MLLKSIKLHNIRSYEDLEINFPLDSVLLAGDIGSGKSTILLAIEFAIFGAKKGELPAYTLLRHNKKEGSSELRMQIDNKDVIIKRTLKRGSNEIRQEAGYIIINGMKREGTAEELRAIMLELLGYPKDLIKKGKDMIYRYTVYTPQEEMKKILYDDKETRLDTLRKVFGIDKYKRIRENSKIIVLTLKEKKKHLEGFTQNLGYKKIELEERKKEIVDIEKKISEILPKIEELKRFINQKKDVLDSIEKEIKELNELKRELSIIEANLVNKIEQNNRLSEELKRFEIQIQELNKELEGKKIEELENIEKRTEYKEKELEEVEINYKNIIKKEKELEVKIDNYTDTIKKIQLLDVCPLCGQKVDEAHKNNVHLSEKKKSEILVEELKKCNEEKSKLEKIRLILKRELDALVKEQNYLSILKFKFESLNEKSYLKNEKSDLKDNIKKQIAQLNTKKTELNFKIKRYSEIEEKYKVVKKEIEELIPQERFLDLEKNGYEREKDSIKRFILSIEKEIEEKQKAKEMLSYIVQLINWIDSFFVDLVSTIEKHVMINIHLQFNEFFRNWFNILLEDETINIRVDEEFTPIIEQDGYETFIDNLSGGEKTSVALSYRLTLNKVVNDIVAEIKTKDIIMLDEPTDGFSSEQLDKIRDVLEQLNMKQVIIVSHESKIEGFVQNIIRIEKQGNVSIVV